MKKLCGLIVFLVPFWTNAISIETSISGFFPTNRTLQKIYGHAWPDVALRADYIQPFCVVPQLSFFGQVDYLFQKGHALVTREDTRIQLIPLTVGIKWIQRVNNYVEVYAGAAPKYYFMRIGNDSDFVPRKSHKNGCGGYATIGIFLFPEEQFIVDLFCSYSYMNFKAPASTLAYTGFRTDVSGFNVGVALGWDF